MGRLSKKAIQAKKEARTKYLITLALQALAGAIIFALITFISLPIAFLITFGCNIARSYMLGEFDK